MWIDKEEKHFYNDCKYHGIRLRFYNEFSQSAVKKLRKFCRWLSVKYWFPIRCNIAIVAQRKFQSIEDGHTYYGIFYPNEEEKPKRYPCICIANLMENSDDEEFCYFVIAHELTHYFQWYFYEDEKKSDRSLEIMATRWANYIVYEYLNKA